MQLQHRAVFEGVPPRADEAFQELLLKFSAAAADHPSTKDTSSLISLFCSATREFFQVDGAYFWKSSLSNDMLIGQEANGWMEDRFRGRHLSRDRTAVVQEAIEQRRAVYINNPDVSRFPMAAEFQAKSLMAVPLIVSGQVIGAAAFLHTSLTDFFNEDMAAKAMILAGQLGSLLEATRLSQVSREEQRRAEILAETAHALHSVPNDSSVMQALVDRLRVLLRTPLVDLLVRDGPAFKSSAFAAESADLETVVRSCYEQKCRCFAMDMAERAISAGETISASIDPATIGLGGFVPAGALLATPFRTSRTKGTILVYPRADGPFTPEEKALVSAVVGFGATAIANAELYSTAHEQAQELRQLLEISSELASTRQLDRFMQQFTLRAAEFLSYGRAFIALRENDEFQIRWASGHGETGPLRTAFPEGPATRKLLNKEVFWSDTVPGEAVSEIAGIPANDMLAVPLLDSGNEVIGMFGVLDRLENAAVSQEHVARACALAAQATVALQVNRHLHLSEQHRRRADSLMRLALELSSFLHLPDFAQRLVARSAEMMSACGGALVIKEGTEFETAVLCCSAAPPKEDTSVQRSFARSVSQILYRMEKSVQRVPAGEALGSDLAASLDWEAITVVKLAGASGELMGGLCLGGKNGVPEPQDEQLLQAMAGHASIALENTRLFGRMEQANRHWIEIFDAISDFIVVHDRADNVLRVNRSLADFIGLPPRQLIGVNMRALLAISKDAPLHSCPFCRNTGDGSDEYVHPVLERTYLVSTSRVHGATSEGLQTIHVLKDITDRREAERRYRELFDNIQEGLFFCTPEGRLIEVNDAMVRMLGFLSREDLLQVSLSAEIYASEGSYQRFSEQMRQHEMVRNHEDSLRRRDGSVIHVLINAFAVRDRQGQVIQYRGVMMDITGLKNFQAELQRERDFSGKILNNTQSLILVADTAGLISYANRRWHDLGYEHRHLLGLPLQDLVAAQRRPALEEAFRSVLSGQQVDNLDLQILRGDASVGQFSVNMSPMRDEQGGVTSLVVVMTDVTDAATLQAKLVHAEKMAAVGQLVSGVAHEVNNPLTAILGFTDLLMENPELPESARKDLRVVLQEAQRTKQIVQNLLSFARQMPPQRKPVQLNIILRRTVQLRAYDLHNHGVQVDEQFDQQLPYVIGDSHQLQQVFLNILNNAYDAVRETGRPARIEIMTARSGDFVEVSFRDNGDGISHPERIFDPFFTTKEIGKGTGLGLSICYGIVHEHGGEILCHNNTGGPGATFVVRLPAVSEMISLGAAAGVVPR